MSIALDIFSLLVLLVSIRNGWKKGVWIAIFNMIAMLFVVFTIIQKYPQLTDYIKGHYPAIPLDFGDYLSVAFLFTVSMVIVYLIRIVFSFFFLLDEPSTIERITGAILSPVPGIMTAALIVFWAYLSPWKTVSEEVEKGFLTRFLLPVSSFVYSAEIDFVTKPLSINLLPNPQVYQPIRPEKGKAGAKRPSSARTKQPSVKK